MVDRLLMSTRDGKLTVFKSGLFSGQNVWLSELKVLTLQVCVFLDVWEGAPSCCSDGHTSPWCWIASLCEAPRHMVSNFPLGWMKTTCALPMRNTATDTIGLRLECSHSHYQTSGVDVFLASCEQLMSKCGHSDVIIKKSGTRVDCVQLRPADCYSSQVYSH